MSAWARWGRPEVAGPSEARTPSPAERPREAVVAAAAPAAGAPKAPPGRPPVNG